jgi:GT2 family glycosyltransferase
LPRVSIVTPSFNQAGFLEDTIRSVLRQDYPNLEYIIMDGGSSDGSVDIIRRHGDLITCWISEPDQGQADAVNKGWQKSTGEILAFLNSDDLYLPGAVSSAVEYMRQHPGIEIVHGNALYVTEDGTVFGVNIPPPFSVRRMLESCFVTQPTVFLRRSVFDRLGGLDETLTHSLDYEYWLRAIPTARFGYIPRFTAAARYHVSAKSSSAQNEFTRQEIPIFDALFAQGKPPYVGADLERTAYVPRLTYVAAKRSGYTEQERDEAARRLRRMVPELTVDEILAQVRENRMYLGTPFRPVGANSPFVALKNHPDPYGIIDGLLELGVVEAAVARRALEIAQFDGTGSSGAARLLRLVLERGLNKGKPAYWTSLLRRKTPRRLRRATARLVYRQSDKPVHPLVGLSVEQACERERLNATSVRSTG